jgi:hypothetical protein
VSYNFEATHRALQVLLNFFSLLSSDISFKRFVMPGNQVFFSRSYPAVFGAFSEFMNRKRWYRIHLRSTGGAEAGDARIEPHFRMISERLPQKETFIVRLPFGDFSLSTVTKKEEP